MVGAVERAVLAAIVVSSLLAGSSSGLAQSGERLVVDPDGNGFDSISAAVEAAESGDTIEVQPGTYEESVQLETDVRLIAPDGATLDGSVTTGGTAGIRIVGDAEPEIVGFRITEYRVGIDAADTSGDWLVRETRVVDSRVIGVQATDAAGDWTILDSAIRNTDGIAVGALPTDDGADAHRIVSADADNRSVACRVRCRTNDGVEFEYDLRLDPDERREARELPGDRPFELIARVENDGV